MRPHVLCRPWNFPASIVEWLAFPFSGILPTQGSNPGVLQCRPNVYQVSHGFFFCLFVCLFVFNPRKQWHPTPVLLSGKFYGWSSLVGCSPWGRWELDTTERLHFHFSLSCIGEGNGNPLQCSCLEDPRDGGAWWAAIYGVAQSWTRLKRLSSSSTADSC